MNKRHYEHTLPNIRGSLSNTYKHYPSHKNYTRVNLSAIPEPEAVTYHRTYSRKSRNGLLIWSSTPAFPGMPQG